MARPIIRVTLTNRSATLHRPFPYEDLIPYYSYAVPGYQYMLRRYPGWDGRKKELKWDKLPTGLFLATRDKIEEELGLKFVIRDERVFPTVRKIGNIESDRAYQNDCVDSMIAAGNVGGLILNATGTGKTRTGAQYCSRVEGPILFVVDQLDLLWQAKKEMEQTLGEKIGFVGNQKFKPRRVTIGTVQTMHRHRRDAKFRVWSDEIEVVIVDEIHVMLNRRNFDVVKEIKPLAVFGLTATLQLKKKPVRVQAYGLAGPVCFEYPLRQGMDENVLSRGVVVRVKVKNEVGL